MTSCNQEVNKKPVKIVFLHHSTGQCIWNGNTSRLNFKIGKYLSKLSNKPNSQAALLKLVNAHNKKNDSKIQIEEITFPKQKPYGWKNYPYDYYNIWIKHAGNKLYLEEPTLEILTEKYDIIMFKHCFPVSNIKPDEESSDINSEYKSISNYKLQYNALKEKMHQFPDKKFIVWTGAAQVESKITEEEAKRAKIFFNWVVYDWDKPDDNIYVWDFYSVQTSDNLYFATDKSISISDSHPGSDFSQSTSQKLFDFIKEVVNKNK